jgi:soluble lytic murein transglycosylase-like protein
VLLAALAVGCGGEPAPAAPADVRGATVAEPDPRAPLRTGPRTLAADLRATSEEVLAAAARWDERGPVPRDLALWADRHQRIVRHLAGRRSRSRAVLPLLPAALRRDVRDLVLAPRELGQIVSQVVGPPPALRVGPAEELATLRGHYRAAWRRFGVSPVLLAAVNHVETAFGRLRNRSVSGARGPMQFMPATWAAYGLGGDVRDPRDAILGAANYLRASGAPRRERAALYAYNPSARYVSAVSRYARLVRRDPRMLRVLYAWQVYAGGRRLTEPPR